VGAGRFHNPRPQPMPGKWARIAALLYNWWTILMRLEIPDKHPEAINSRPLALHGIARRTRHGNQTTLEITSTHSKAKRDHRDPVCGQRLSEAHQGDCGAVEPNSAMALNPQCSLSAIPSRKNTGKHSKTHPSHCVTAVSRIRVDKMV